MTRILALLTLLLIPVSHAANPTQLCPTAKTGDRAPSCSVPLTCGVPTQANDMVRTVVASVQVWEPYSTLTPGSNVIDCTKGTWSTVAQIALPLFSSLPPPVTVPPVVVPPPVVTPPVVTPPVIVPPVIVSVTIKPLAPSDPPQATVTYSAVPAGSCFSLSDGTHTTQACLPQ